MNNKHILISDCIIQSLPGFKAPKYMGKHLQTYDAKKERILQMPNFGNTDTSFSSWLQSGQYEPNISPGFLDMEVHLMYSAYLDT